MCAIGCGEKTTSGNAPTAGVEASKLRVLTSTAMIADAVTRIAGNDVEVDSLMGAGVDPHLYHPTPQDRGKLQKADVVLYHGLHLEGNMIEVFEALAQKDRTVVAVSRDIPVEKLLAWEGDLHDPHVWHDVSLWSRCVQTVAEVLSERNPSAAADYRGRSDEYLNELEQLHQDCIQSAQSIPADQRWLLTSHDAFHYFGRAYGFEVIGLQGISTESEAGLKAITDAVDLIKSHKLPTIFPETSVPRSAIERVSRDSGAALGPELYSDALGGPGSNADTYVGMIKANMKAVVEGLSTQPK